MNSTILSILILFSLLFNVYSENWPAWRGPTGNGVSEHVNFPSKFSNTENVNWKLALPGVGSSTPAIWGDKIFVTSAIGSKDGVSCFSKDGNKLWDHTFGQERGGKHKNGSGSNPSPVTDGNNIYLYYKSGTLAALDLDGKKVWFKNLQDEFGADTLWWDLGTSPVLTEEFVIIAVMQEYEGGNPSESKDSYLVAFSKDSGKLAWKTNRTYKVKAETGQSYTTPLVVGEKSNEVIITFGSDHLTGHSAKDGKLIWDCGGYNPTDKAMWRVIASPSISNGIVVVPYGRKGHFAAVKAGGKGDITKTNRLWTKDVGADVPSPIAHDGKAYLVTDRGHIYCFNLESGEEIWNQKLPRSSASYYSSPIISGERMVLAREDGVVMVMKLLDGGFDLVSKNEMNERIIASPIPIDNHLFLRGQKHLFCLGD